MATPDCVPVYPVLIPIRSVDAVDLVEVCTPQNCNVGLLAYSPLAGGSLSGKYLDAEKSAKSRLNLFPGYMARYNKSLAKVCSLVSHHDHPPIYIALISSKTNDCWIYEHL